MINNTVLFNTHLDFRNDFRLFYTTLSDSFTPFAEYILSGAGIAALFTIKNVLYSSFRTVIGKLNSLLFNGCRITMSVLISVPFLVLKIKLQN